MDRFDDDNLLAAELRALRPTPRPEFAAELDRRAAAGFPRGADTTASVFAPLAAWWRSSSLIWRFAPACTVILVAVVAVTVAISTSGGGTAGDVRMIHGVEQSAGGGTEEAAESGEAMGGAAVGAPRSTEHSKIQQIPAPAAANAEVGAEAEESAMAEEAGGVEEEYAVPSHAKEMAPTKALRNSALDARDIERSSFIVLGTKPGHVSAAAAKVFTAVHAAHGIVLHSSVQSGNKGATGASFSLLIPSAKLDDALGEISGIAEVRARHDATNDITAPTVSASEELADSNASIESLLKQLGDAETESEQESLETRLHEERSRHAAIRGSLDHLHERASMSEVSVRIVTGNGAGVAPPSKGSSGSSWGVGDALHDAGNILVVVASVILIGLAIVGPIAIIAILIWGGNRLRVRRLRERTLG
jgi:Domain of unknown function (DUF4349)